MIKNPHVDHQENNFSEDMPQGQDFDLSEKKYKKKNILSKLIFGLFLFLGISTLLFAFLNLHNNIRSPFLNQENNINEQTQVNAREKIVEMQNTDTDEDGLSDYDEEYIYGTSPYLADTDSDGFTDKQEVDNEHDPLCPTGANCNGTDIQNIEENVLPSDSTSTNDELPLEIVNELENLTPEQIRQLLIESGAMTEEDINQISDDKLIEMFNELLKEI